MRIFDVAVVDIMMPRLTGILACKEIRKLQGYSHDHALPGARNIQAFRFEIGIDDYMVKPLQPQGS